LFPKMFHAGKEIGDEVSQRRVAADAGTEAVTGSNSKPFQLEEDVIACLTRQLEPSRGVYEVFRGSDDASGGKWGCCICLLIEPRVAVV
jgi:hypothetical protein